MNQRITALTRLLQFSDATFPVGTFSFSNGLETASYEKTVHDAATLEQYARAAARQAAFSDGVAALAAHRATLAGDAEALRLTDSRLILFKMNDEARLMLRRMGKKLAELGVKLFPESKLLADWLADIDAGRTPGSYPVAQGIVFALAGLSEEDLYASSQYGVINMILGAALRCVRVSHYDTQQILFRLAAEIPDLFAEAREMDFADMNCFVPEMDILASLHEKGAMRMFMS
ncbi:MAG: urease accessory UreF family protein [Muribaculaceae bacterium]|nr:urease accessory UreF family protein [Muribaculaceae bacterium]